MFSNIFSFFNKGQSLDLGGADGPKVLHVGNVANLAFVNARLLNSRGYINHLLAPDFYHFASCPEWQDMIGKPVDRKDLGDDWFPNFHKSNVPEVPAYEWVAQGPAHLAIIYLYFLAKNDPRAKLTRKCLEFQRLKATYLRDNLPQSKPFSQKQVLDMLKETRFKSSQKKSIQQGASSDSILSHFRRVVSSLYGEDMGTSISPPLSYQNAVAYAGVDNMLNGIWRELNGNGDAYATGIVMPPEMTAANCPLPEGVREEDAAPYSFALPWWKALFDCYDEVVLYGSSVIYGLLTGVKYHAYEHGNIRSIPFKDDTLGRLTKRAYENAENVFITNTDYVIAKPRLEFEESKRHFIPHAFEENILFDFKEKFKSAKNKSSANVKFFSPARQDWVKHDPSLNKGNDKVIKAIKNLVDQSITNFNITFVDWGQDANASKKLISSLGIEDRVKWVNPLPKGELWKQYISAHAVLDQFFLDAFGGVTYEALAAGARVITRDDGIANQEFFDGDAPPLLAANSVSEIEERMRQVILDADDKEQIGPAGIDWIKRKHSANTIKAVMHNAFENSLSAD